MIKQFVKQYLLFSLLIIVLAAFPVIRFLDTLLILGFLYNFFIFFVLVFISMIIILKSLMKNLTNFYIFFLGGIAVKMIIALVYFYFIFDIYKDYLILFVGSFFISYLIFTIFEIIFLVKSVKKLTKT